MQHEAKRDVDQRPGRVEQRQDAGACHRLPEGIEVAHGVARLRAETTVEIGGEQVTGELPVQPSAGANEQARSGYLEQGEGAEADQEQKGKKEKGDDATGGYDPVVYLQHVEGWRQVEQVDRGAKTGCVKEMRTARPERALEQRR